MDSQKVWETPKRADGSIRILFIVGGMGVILLLTGMVAYDAFDLALFTPILRLANLLLATCIMSVGATITSSLLLGYWRLYRVKLLRIAALATPLLPWWSDMGLVLLLLGYNQTSTYSPIRTTGAMQSSSLLLGALQSSPLISIGAALTFTGWTIWAAMFALWGAALLSLHRRPNSPPVITLPGMLLLMHAVIQLVILFLAQYPTGISAIPCLSFILLLAITWQVAASLQT